MLKDPMHEAISRRRSHSQGLDHLLGPNALDDAKLDGQPGGGTSSVKPESENKGDLAPEATAHNPLSSKQEEAIHASDHHAGALKGAVAELHDHNPEQEPLPRGDGMGTNPMGHEQSTSGGSDMDVENMLMQGHEHEMGKSPKTLGAHVRAALQSKKGK